MFYTQDTSPSCMVFMADSTDHITGKTGLTLTITLSKDGGAFGSISPTVTERGNGWYKLALTSSHTDTAGEFAMHITGTGADPADVHRFVLSPNVAYFGVNVVTLAAAAVQSIWDALTSALTTSGSIGKWILDKLDVVLSTRLASSSYTAPPSAATNASAVRTELTTELGRIDAATSTRAAAATALDNTVWTNTKAGYLDAPISEAGGGGGDAAVNAVVGTTNSRGISADIVLYVDEIKSTTLIVLDADTLEPVDLSGLGNLVLTIETSTRTVVQTIANADLGRTNDDVGQVVFTNGADVTASERPLRYSLRVVDRELLLTGQIQVKYAP